ncbi:MAG: UPF0149 family protein [Oceanicoccus sp.]
MTFNKQQEKTLRKSLDRLHGREAAFSYYQLQGFLFAIACSPETIKPSEWFDLIWLNDEPQFDSETEARDFFSQVVSLSVHIADMAQQRRFLPFSARYSERWQNELAEWCEGLLVGHQYLEDVWLIAIDDVNDNALTDDVDASLNLAATFADASSARQLSFDDEIDLGGDHLAEAYELFWKVLGTYATMGHVWADGSWDYNAEQLFLALEPAAHDEPCPCGSGINFSSCCLH